MSPAKMKRPPCIRSGVDALCGRPARYQEQEPFLTALQWFMAADPNGIDTCPECLSVVRHALEQSELANRRGGGLW